MVCGALYVVDMQGRYKSAGGWQVLFSQIEKILHPGKGGGLDGFKSRKL